ncbi:MAG TPA: hypothetical protein VKB96_08640, partial [Gammaproteobacteria bacterium]|nr:hypothetical protein [Gammaproteobacteria bacterium]
MDITPNGAFAYVAVDGVWVISTATNTVTTIVPVGVVPVVPAVNPTGTFVYVPNCFSNTVSVIDTTYQYGDRHRGVETAALKSHQRQLVDHSNAFYPKLPSGVEIPPTAVGGSFK